MSKESPNRSRWSIGRRVRVAAVVGVMLAANLWATGPAGFEAVDDVAGRWWTRTVIWYGAKVKHDPYWERVWDINHYPVGAGNTLSVTTDGGTVITVPVGPEWGFTTPAR